jgi:uncharacterized tellurite resistance protein B-like protein
MPTVVVVFLLIVMLTAVISLGILHLQFRNWRPYLWKQSVLRRVAELRSRRSELTGPDPDGLQARLERLASGLFERHLQTISVDRLAEFPGIGPGTVGRVRDAGGRALADLRRFPFASIQGIGPSKAHDLQTAVAKLVREAQSRFDAGGCSEAVEFQRKLARLQVQEQDRAIVRQRELSAIERALRSTEDLLGEARDVTFWNYLFRRTTNGPRDETMNRPLPSPVPSKPSAVPVAKLVSRPNPPAVPVPLGRPVVAKPAPPPAAFPPSVGPRRTHEQSEDIFAAELANTKSSPVGSADAHPELPKLAAYARFGFLVAKADGRVAVAETKVIRAFLDDRFGHDPILVRHIDPLMERTANRVPPESQALADIKAVATPEEWQALFSFAERVADASGERKPREQEMLFRLAEAFALTPKPAAVKPAPTAGPPTDPRCVLEIDPGTDITAELIRRRFTLLNDRLDPSKAAGLGPEFAAMAAEKRNRVRQAAEALMAPFGEPLEKPTPPPPADLRHNPDLDDAFGG